MDKHNRSFDEDIQWNRFVNCVRLPDPGDDSQIMDYIRSIGNEHINSFESVFKLCDKNSDILEEVTFKGDRATERQDAELVEKLQEWRLRFG